MPLPIIVVIAVVALIGWSFMHGTATQQRIDATLHTALARGEQVWEWLLDKYEEHIQPTIRRAGYVAIGLMLLGIIGLLFLAKGWIIGIGLGAAVVAVALIGFQMARPPQRFSALNLASAIFVGFNLLGWVLVLCGVYAQDRSVVVIGVMYIVMARMLLAFVVKTITAAAAYGVYSAEGGTNFLFRTAVAFMPKSVRDGLQTVIPQAGVVYAVEETWMPAVDFALRRFDATQYPVLIVAMLLPRMPLFGLGVLFGLAVYMLYATLEGTGIGTHSRRERAVLLFEKLVYVLMAVAALTILIPGADSKIDGIWEASIAIAGAFLDRLKEILTDRVAMGYLVTALIALGVSFLHVFWFRKREIVNGVQVRSNQHHAPVIRWISMAAFGVFALWNLGKLLTHFAHEEVADATDVIADGAFQRFIPTARATVFEGKPAVRLGWKNMPEVEKYNLERRELHETKFAPIMDGQSAMDFSEGVTQYEDIASLVPGKTYFYRVMAVGKDGKLRFSKPTQVIIPAAAPAPNAATSATPSATQKPASAPRPRSGHAPNRMACSTCTNDGREQFCARHPESPACQ